MLQAQDRSIAGRFEPTIPEEQSSARQVAEDGGSPGQRGASSDASVQQPGTASCFTLPPQYCLVKWIMSLSPWAWSHQSDVSHRRACQGGKTSQESGHRHDLRPDYGASQKVLPQPL